MTAAGSDSYVNYLLPGLIMTAAVQPIGTSTWTVVDTTGGSFNRERAERPT